MKLIEKLLGNLYLVYSYDSAEKALYQLERDLKPFAVLTANVLPKKSGIELLNITKRINPSIIRIILTSVDDTKEIVQLLQKSDASFYIKKPFNNLDFLQVIRNSNLIYNYDVENRYFRKDKGGYKDKFTDLQSEYKKLQEKYDDELKTILNFVSKFIKLSMKFSFKDHVKDVTVVAKKLAKNMGITDEENKNLGYAALLSNHYRVIMPDRLSLLDPRICNNEDDKENFNKYFKKSLSQLIQFPSIKLFAEMAAKIFENRDGSGEPFGISELDYPKEIGILNLVNLYFNLVYSLKENDLIKLKLVGKVVQTRPDTIERHKEAVTFLYRNIKWFDHDLFYRFQDMLKKRDLDELKFNEEDLVIRYESELYGTPLFTKHELNSFFANLSSDRKCTIQVLDNNGILKDSYTELQVDVNSLEIDHKLSKPIKTYKGSILINSGTEIKESHLEIIKKHIDKKAISEFAYIRINSNKSQASIDDDNLDN